MFLVAGLVAQSVQVDLLLALIAGHYHNVTAALILVASISMLFYFHVRFGHKGSCGQNLKRLRGQDLTSALVRLSSVTIHFVGVAKNFDGFLFDN